MDKDYFSMFLSYIAPEHKIISTFRNTVIEDIREGEYLSEICEFLQDLLIKELIRKNCSFVSVNVEFNKRVEQLYFDVFGTIEFLSEEYDFYIGVMALNLETFSPEHFNWGVSRLVEEVIEEFSRLQLLQDEEKMLLELLDRYMFREPDATEMCTVLQDYIKARRLSKLGRKEVK